MSIQIECSHGMFELNVYIECSTYIFTLNVGIECLNRMQVWFIHLKTQGESFDKGCQV